MNQIIKRLTTVQQGKGTLVCFPFAGGNASAFRPICKLLTSFNWSVWAIEPAGHGSNRQPLIDDLETMLVTYEKVLTSDLQEPFVFFGHSMGGLIAYLLTQRMERTPIYPKALIISSTIPPHKPIKPMSGLSDQELLRFVESLGGIPKELLSEKELLDYFLKLFRADVKAVEGYVHRNPTQVKAPVYIFGGDLDKLCPYDLLQDWQKWVKQAKFYQFSGGHMYWLRNGEGLALRIHSVLDRVVNSKS